MSTYSYSTTVADALLNVLAGTTIATNAYATSGNVYVQLHTASPGTAGTSAISVGSTTRVLVAFGSASAGTATMTTSNPSWTNGGTSETLTAISIWSASTSGTFIASGQLGTSEAWVSGNVFELTSLSVALPTAA